MAMAPPDMPSPVTIATLGTPSDRQASVERAIASAWPRSSAPMPGHQRLLPWRQIAIEVGERLRRLVLDPGYLVADVAAACGKCAQLVDLGFKLGDGFFEVEIAAHRVGHQLNIGRKGAGGEAVL